MAEKTPRRSKKQFEQYRKLLLDRREELAQSVRSHAASVPETSLGGATGDSGDHASQDYMTELFGVLMEKQAGTLEEVEHALAKIDAGDYGQCERCNDKIAAKRLKAIPWAKLCRQCQEQQDRINAVRKARISKAVWTADD